MGAKYANAVISGFNSNPPPDDGSEVEANEINWAFHVDKLAQPILTLAQTINSRLVTHFDEGPTSQNSNFTLTVAEYNQVVEFNGTALTATLPDAATIGSGYFTTIVNTSSTEDLTIALATSGNTLQGIADGTITLQPNEHIKVIVNEAASGYLVTALQRSFNSLDESHWPSIANNATDAEHDIDILPGSISDSARTTVITLPATITKIADISSGWVEGTNQSGFPSGVNGGNIAADSEYHVFVIAKPDGVTDGGFDIAADASNLLADAIEYTRYRRVGSIYTDGSANIIAFVQFGRYFRFADGVVFNQDVFTHAPSTELDVAHNIRVPSGVGIYKVIFTWSQVGGAGTIIEEIRSDGEAINTLNYLTSSTSQMNYLNNDTGAIEYESDAGGINTNDTRTIRWYIHGYIDDLLG